MNPNHNPLGALSHNMNELCATCGQRLGKHSLGLHCPNPHHVGQPTAVGDFTDTTFSPSGRFSEGP
jgi:hypothetical protein